MAQRKDGQQRTDADDNGGFGTRVGRRGLLKLAGTGLLATVAGVGTASADESGNGSLSPLPIGGGEGYQNVVTQEEADTVVRTLGDLEDALAGAAAGDVVFVPGDATIDMGSMTLDVPSRVTLASDRGVDGSPGALLSTDDEPNELLRAAKGVRITGLRLHGPNPGSQGGSSSRAAGVTTTGLAVEIDNTEIRAFSYAGVLVRGGWIHLHHNVITECNKGGLGYGVSQTAGYNGIEFNYFDFNRHSVASDGEHRGYVCRYNHFGPRATSYVIDAHAPACERIKVYNNVVEADKATHGHNAGKRTGTCKVRGVPDDLASYRNNWFYNPMEPRNQPSGNTGEAIVQWADVSDWRNVSWSGNHYGADANVSFSDVIPGYDGNRSD